MCLVCIASRGIKSGPKRANWKVCRLFVFSHTLSLSRRCLSVSPLSFSTHHHALSIYLVHVVAPRCLPSTFWGQIWAALFAWLCVGNSALFALLLHPANTLSACLAALGSLDCTQATLEIGLINIQYARITHSLVACSASRWAPLIKSISLSLSLSTLSHSSSQLSISLPVSFPLACSFQINFPIIFCATFTRDLLYFTYNCSAILSLPRSVAFSISLLFDIFVFCFI